MADARMVGLGALGGTPTHASDCGHRNRTDRRQWRQVRHRAKRAIKGAERNAWKRALLDLDSENAPQAR